MEVQDRTSSAGDPNGLYRGEDLAARDGVGVGVERMERAELKHEVNIEYHQIL